MPRSLAVAAERVLGEGSMVTAMRLVEVVAVSDRVGSTRSRLRKVEELAGFLRRLSPEEAEICVAYLSGAARQGRIGVGPAILRQLGELPAASEPSIEVLELDRALTKLGAVKGGGSSTKRRELLGALYLRATLAEQDFLTRVLAGELRQGALEGVMVDAIAQAANVPAERVRRAFMLAGALHPIAAAALASGVEGLDRFRLELFRPLRPMLAQPAADVDEALEHLGQAVLEPKLDGIRLQLHKAEQEVRVFSRDGHDVTAAVPEVVELAFAFPAKTAVLDGEALALRADRSPQPFQVSMRRFGRRLEVEKLREELPLSFFAFDLMHLDGEDVLDRPYVERAAALDERLGASARIERRWVHDAEEAERFYAEVLQRGHEGVLAKSAQSSYEAGQRGGSWLKLKPAHTLDLVVLAVEWGSGRRSGWLSNLHLGARDPEKGGFVMLGKTFKGMTDEMLRWQTEWCLAHELGRDGYVVHVKPELVAEIAFDSVQQSPHYDGGMALRFARVKRYRPDKRAEEADTVQTVRALLERTHGAGPR